MYVGALFSVDKPKAGSARLLVPRWVTSLPSMWDGISRWPVSPSATCVMRMVSPTGS